MKILFIGAVFLLSSSVLANPYKSEFVDVSFQIQEGKKTFQLVCQPNLTMGELPRNWVDACNDIGKKLLELAGLVNLLKKCRVTYQIMLSPHKLLAVNLVVNRL